MDALAAIIISIMISLMGIHLIKKAFSELIDTSLDQQLIEQVRKHILSIGGITAIHSLRSRSMGGLGFIDTEIRVNPRLSVSEAHYISLSIEKTVKKNFDEITDITVHIDPVAETEHEALLLLPKRSELLFSLYSVWEGLENAEHIHNIHLHYLTRQIEIDVILPLRFGCSNQNNLATEVREKAQSIAYVGKVNIYYAP